MIKDNVLHSALQMYGETIAEQAIDMTLSSSFLKPDQRIIKQLKTTLDDETVYTYSPGGYQQRFKQYFIDFIEDMYAIKLDEAQILPCAGTNQIIASSLFALLEQGDTVLLPSPGYPAYQNMAEQFQLTTHYYDTIESSEAILADILFKVNSLKPKLILLNFPVNPTGRMLSLEQYQSIIQAARRAKSIILNDCILNDFDFYKPKFSIFNSVDTYDGILELYSFSKAHSMSGIRVGCLYGDQQLLHPIRNARYIYEFDVGAFALQAGMLAMQHSDETLENSKHYIQDNLEGLVKVLDQTKTSYIMPDGGVSVLAQIPVNHIDVTTFCQQFYYYYGVKVLPGSIYGEGFDNVFRITLMQTKQAFEQFAVKYPAFIDQLKTFD